MSESEEKEVKKEVKKEVCPYCDKEFTRLDMHRCDQLPRFERSMRNMAWRHLREEPDWTWERDGVYGYIRLEDSIEKWEDFKHDVISVLQKLRKPIKFSKKDKTIKIIGL